MVILIGLAVSVIAAANAVVQIAEPVGRVISLPIVGPTSGTALAIDADRRLVLGNTPKQLLAAQAQQALRLDPLLPRALRVYAMTQYPQDRDAQRRILTLAMSLSRRDVGTDYWFIDDHARRDDVAGALASFDIALRVSPDLGPLLFPNLAGMLQDERVRRGFVHLVAVNPSWMLAFYDTALSAPAAVPALAMATIEAKGLPRTPLYRARASALIGALVTGNQFDLARQIYLQEPGADRQLPVSPAITPASTDARYAPISWQLLNEPSFGGGVAKNGVALTGFAAGGSGGAIARKLLFLSPGRYLYSFHLADNTMQGDATLTTQLTCAAGGAVLQTIVASGSRLADYATSFSVPDHCGAQFITMTMAGGSSQEDSNVVIDHIIIRPAN